MCHEPGAMSHAPSTINNRLINELFHYILLVLAIIHFFVSSFLRSFVSSFFIYSFLRFFVSSFLRFFVSSFLRFFVSSFLRFVVYPFYYKFCISCLQVDIDLVSMCFNISFNVFSLFVGARLFHICSTISKVSISGK